jgi:orotate phosphoribosyltransferase-like protein
LIHFEWSYLQSRARSQFFDSGEHKKVLVVDDSIASGSAMIEVKESLKHLEDKFDLKYCYLCNS